MPEIDSDLLFPLLQASADGHRPPGPIKIQLTDSGFVLWWLDFEMQLISARDFEADGVANGDYCQLELGDYYWDEDAPH